MEIAHTANNLVSGQGTVALTSDQVTNFVVTIDIDPSSYQDLIAPGKPYPFRPGMSASVSIFTKTVENVVSVSIQAVTARERSELEKDKDEGEDGKAKQVKNTDDDDELVEIVFVTVGTETVEVREVKTGIQDDDYIEILTGIKDGEEVVTGPYAAISRKLDDGDDIQIDNEEKDEEEEDEDE